MTPEEQRLAEARNNISPWKKWGPYLGDRQWGTVREDYSAYGSAWDYFSHDQARSRAYRWGEDGIGGISDDRQLLCFAIALWNGADPILKERLFGLTGNEGNHGEDVKEYYFYLDSTPSHSYMKMLYKYPQQAFPYTELAEENRRRSRHEPEFELIDTGIFDQNQYFDVFVEYAKADSEDILIQITVANRSAEPKTLHLLPTLWFRNTWSWDHNTLKPRLKATTVPIADGASIAAIEATHPTLGQFQLYCQGKEEAPALLFTENETNLHRLFGVANAAPYVKDGINDYVIHSQTDAINPAQIGTKAAAHYPLILAPHETQVIKLRLRSTLISPLSSSPFTHFDSLFQTRQQEA
ncbi:glucosidase, partial [filamentous cyanobacterium CCP2]